MAELIQFVSELRIVLLISYACSVFALCYNVRTDFPGHSKSIPNWFMILSLVIFILVRLPLMVLNEPLNPDEAQFLANAITFRSNMNSWLSSDGGSAGPLIAYLLMWPFIFGAEIGFTTARITAAILICGTWLFFLSALNSAPRFIRIFLGASLIIFLGGIQESDFLSYSSETVTEFFIICALAIIINAVDQPPGKIKLFMIGLCLGSAPFCKIHSTPIAVFLGLIALWQAWDQPQERCRSCFLLILGAFLPAITLLTPLTIAGGFSEFWSIYIIGSITYLDDGWGSQQGMRWFDALITIPLCNKLLFAYVAAMVYITIIAAIEIAIRKVMGVSDSINIRDKRKTVKAIIGLAMLVVSVWTVVMPARIFYHYAILYIWPLAIAPGLLWSLDSHWSRRINVGALTVLFITFCSVVIEQKHPFNPDVASVERIFDAGHLMPEPDGKRGRMLVWGWVAEWYVWSGWAPATRYAGTLCQIWPGKNRAGYRDRMMQDLRNKHPEYIVDGITANSFGFRNQEKYGYATFYELAEFLSEDYVLLYQDTPAASCPKVFARKDVADAIKRYYATPSRIYASSEFSSNGATASANRVADGLVFEACLDAWLLPDGQTGEITIELEGKQAISSVEILNTRGGTLMNRATKDARVIAYQDGAVIMDQRIRTLRFPFWSQLAIPETVSSIDKLVVRVESYAGVGGGLNEIRLRKR